MTTAAAARALTLALLVAACGGEHAARTASDTTSATQSPAAAGAVITAPDGFAITVFADDIGQARHVVVAPNGTAYVNTWRSPYDTAAAVPAGGYVVALRDTNRDGTADLVQRFGPTSEAGGSGGTGIALAGDALYVESDTSVLRFTLPADGIVPTAPPDTIVTGLPTGGEHPQHTLAVDARNNLFVTVGSATNSCQVKNRTPGSPGERPCRQLATRAGVWRFDATRTGQRFSSGARWATGLRNAVGIAINPADGRLYAMVHGRDDLWGNWPKLYTPKAGAELPAETLVRIERGGDYGWPYCYFDGEMGKLVQSPEYGGDGKKVGDCADRKAPLAAFPAHWAPNGLSWYTGTAFPERYRAGAFVAFHGSWNRTPEPQGGYNVVFQPFAGGKATGRYEVFADGFAGPTVQPAQAAHRPVGVTVGPDGSLYVTDDRAGRVWQVRHQAR